MDSIFRKSALIGVAEIVFRLPLVFTVGYLARSIGAEDFGNWALVVAFQVFVGRLCGLGLSSSMFRYASGCKASEAAGYFRFAVALSLLPVLVTVALTFILTAPIGKLLGIKAEFHWLLPMAVLLGAGSVADGFLDAFLKSRMAIGRQICFVAARTFTEVAAVVLVFMVTLPSVSETPMRLAWYAGLILIGKLVIYPGLLVGMTKGGSLPPTDRRREFLNYGLVMVPVGIVGWLINQSDRLVLSHFVPKADLGVYAFGASLAAYVVFLGYAVYPLLLPQASKLHDRGDAAGVRALFKGTQMLFMVLWSGCMICLALWTDDIIAWTGGEAFAGARDVFLILAFAIGVDYQIGIYQYAFNLVKRPDHILWLNLGHAAMIAGSVAVAAMTSGIALAAWAVLAATVTFNVIQYRFVRRYMYLPLRATMVVQIVVLGGLTALLARYAADWSELLRLAITAVTMLVLATVALRRRAPLAAGNPSDPLKETAL